MAALTDADLAAARTTTCACAPSPSRPCSSARASPRTSSRSPVTPCPRWKVSAPSSPSVSQSAVGVPATPATLASHAPFENRTPAEARPRGGARLGHRWCGHRFRHRPTAFCILPSVVQWCGVEQRTLTRVFTKRGTCRVDVREAEVAAHEERRARRREPPHGRDPPRVPREGICLTPPPPHPRVLEYVSIWDRERARARRGRRFGAPVEHRNHRKRNRAGGYYVELCKKGRGRRANSNCICVQQQPISLMQCNAMDLPVCGPALYRFCQCSACCFRNASAIKFFLRFWMIQMSDSNVQLNVQRATATD